MRAEYSTAVRWLAVALVVMVAAPARADSGEDQARAHFRAGQAAYARGEWRVALDEFRVGYALSPRPEFLLNFAQSYRKLGEYERAIVECERFVATAPPEPLATQARQLLAQLREEQARARSDETPPPVTQRSPPTMTQSQQSPPPMTQSQQSPPTVTQTQQTQQSPTVTHSPPPTMTQPTVTSTPEVAQPPAARQTKRRRWVLPVIITGVGVAVLAATGLALGLTLGAHDTYPAAPLGGVSFR